MSRLRSAPVYPPHQRVLKENREPLPFAGSILPVLQLHPHSQEPQGHASDGGWRARSALVDGGRCLADRRAGISPPDRQESGQGPLSIRSFPETETLPRKSR